MHIKNARTSKAPKNLILMILPPSRRKGHNSYKTLMSLAIRIEAGLPEMKVISLGSSFMGNTSLTLMISKMRR